jgi:hypothetical protein
MELLRELFDEEVANVIKIIKKAKKKEKEDFYDSLLKQLNEIEAMQIAYVLSRYMDSCRSIQREQ